MNTNETKKHLVVKSTGELVMTLNPALIEDKVLEMDLSNVPGNHKVIMVQFNHEEKLINGELYDDPFICLRGSAETLEGLVKWLIDPYWEGDQLIPLVYPPSLDELHSFEDWLGFFGKPQHDYIDNVAIIENPGRIVKQMKKEGINEITIPLQNIKGEKMKKIIVEIPVEGKVVTHDENGNVEIITTTDTRTCVSQIVEDMEETFNFYLHGGSMLNIEAKYAHDGSVKINHNLDDNTIIVNINDVDVDYTYELSPDPEHVELNAIQVGDYLGCS